MFDFVLHRKKEEEAEKSFF